MVAITQAAEVANRICLALKIKSVQLMSKKLTCACNDVNKMATKRNVKKKQGKEKQNRHVILPFYSSYFKITWESDGPIWQL